MLDVWKRERLIRKTLHQLARQRVALILQPGNAWVVENAVADNDEAVAAALRTCQLRGWAAVEVSAVPHGSLTPSGDLPRGPIADRISPIYRLTEAGWNVIHRSQAWVLATFAIAAATLLATLASLFVVVRFPR
jgi:hypothetical protein